eukprot:5854050-Alexandrium_andersonii.AAC.1
MLHCPEELRCQVSCLFAANRARVGHAFGATALGRRGLGLRCPCPLAVPRKPSLRAAPACTSSRPTCAGTGTCRSCRS